MTFTQPIRLFFFALLLGTTTTLLAQGNWSDPASWPAGSVPTAGAEVTIPAGQTIRLDVSPPPLAGLRINGTLEVTAPTVALSAEWILVQGLFRIGTEDAPYAGEAVITLTGADVDVDGMGGRFLGTVNGGSLEFHGASAGKRAWVQLGQHAFRGATSLELAEVPANWSVGDEVVLAPSGYDPFDAEVVTITGIEGGDVTFSPALRADHWGEFQLYADRVIDERAEVAMLTRNIVVQSPPSAVAENFGAHTMIMAGSGPVRLEGVAFRGMGQPGKEARYSFHWHLAGDRTGDYVKNCTVRDALQRGIVVHGTDNVLVEGNVAFNVRNHAYIPAEDGNEIHNMFRGNIAVLVRRVPNGQMAFPDSNHPDTKSRQAEHRASAFWLRNVHNHLIGNVAAGVERGVGFFYDNMGRHRDFRHFDLLPEPIVFSGNVAHGCAVPGVNNNAGSNVAMYTQVGHGFGLFIDNFEIGNDDAPYVFGNFLAYKNGMSGIWNEETNVVFTDMIFADNTSAYLSGEGLVEHSLVVGQSADTIGGRNRVLRHGNQRAGFYTVTQGGKKRPRFKDVTFVNMHDGTDPDREAAAFILDYKLDLRSNYTEDITLINTRPAWMETMGSPGRTPSGAMLFDRDGSLSGYGEPIMFLHPTSPLRRDDCDFVEEWNAALCPADQYINLTVPRVDNVRFRFYLDHADSSRVHDSGLNTRYSRMRAREETTLVWDNVEEPVREFGIGFSPMGTSTGDFVYLRIPYPYDGAILTDQIGEMIPRVSSASAVYNADQTAYHFDATTGWILLKAYATGAGDANGLDWVNITEGEQEVTTVAPATNTLAINATSVSLYPNPAVEQTTLRFELIRRAEVRMTVTDVLGRVVVPAEDFLRSAGGHEIDVPVAGLSTGIYHILLQTGDQTVSVPITVSRQR